MRSEGASVHDYGGGTPLKSKVLDSIFSNTESLKSLKWKDHSVKSPSYTDDCSWKLRKICINEKKIVFLKRGGKINSTDILILHQKLLQYYILH